MRIGDNIDAFGNLNANWGNVNYAYPWGGSADVFGLGAQAVAKAKKNPGRRHPHGMFGMGYLGQQTTEGVPFEVTVTAMPGNRPVPKTQLMLLDSSGKITDVQMTGDNGKALILAPAASFWDTDYVIKVTGLPIGYANPTPAQMPVVAGKNDQWAGRNLLAIGMRDVPHKVSFVLEALGAPLTPGPELPVPPLPLSPEEQVTWDQIQAQNQPQPAPQQTTQINPTPATSPTQPAQAQSKPAAQAPKTNVRQSSMLPANFEKYTPYILVGGVALLIGYVIFPKIIGGRK